MLGCFWMALNALGCPGMLGCLRCLGFFGLPRALDAPEGNCLACLQPEWGGTGRPWVADLGWHWQCQCFREEEGHCLETLALPVPPNRSSLTLNTYP
jgi:hypothetical protein